MGMYKVEICGVNTAKLPLLSEEEKKELFDKIGKGDRAAREICVWYLALYSVFIIPGRILMICFRLAASD